MKTLISILAVIVIHSIIKATPQQPDLLEYGNRTLRIHTGWGHPSPLETYFLQTGVESPFSMLSTGNYRGHVAVWKVKDNLLLLKEIRVEDSILTPNSLAVFAGRSNEILADWFNGIIQAANYDEEVGKEELSVAYFRVRSGKIIEVIEFNNQEWESLYDDNEEIELSQEKLGMLKMYENYLTFYFRLREEKIEIDGKNSFLLVGASKLSPIFQYCGNDILKWPYNWENTSICGAPNPLWKISKDSLFITEFSLKSGLRFDGAEIVEASLDTLGIDLSKGEPFFMERVNGVYLISHGFFPAEKENPKMYDFETTSYTLVRFENGIVLESFELKKDFRFNPPSETDPRIIKLIEKL